MPTETPAGFADAIVPFDDGYNRVGVVAPHCGIGEIRITYRPCDAQTTFDYLNAPKGGEVKAAVRTLVLKKHLLGWNLLKAESKDEVSPITAETVGNLRHSALIRIMDIVTGYGSAEQETDRGN